MTTSPGARASGASSRIDIIDARGVELEFLPREAVSGHPHLPSARDLFYFRNHDSPGRTSARQVGAGGGEREPGDVGDLHRCLGGAKATWEQLLSLVANGNIEINLDDGAGAG